MARLGGTTIDLNPTTSQIGRGEPIKDTARVLSRYCDVIAIRTFDHSKLKNMQNGLPSLLLMLYRFRTCQALADFLTIKEEFDELEDVVVTFVGDGQCC